MRIHNKKIKKTIKLIYTFIFLGVLLSFAIEFFEIHFFNFLPIPIFLGIFIILLLLILALGKQIFEYDSDGEALNFKNKEVFLGQLIPIFTKNAEFPRDKLIKYSINRFLFKKNLALYVKSRQNHKGYTKLNYNITYLDSENTKRIKHSLDEIIAQNTAH